MSSSVFPYLPSRTRAPLAAAAAPLPALRSAKLLDRLRERIRLMYYSQRTEETYVDWCRAFIRFHGLRHPADIGKQEVEAFLTHLAVERQVAVSTHRQALSALLFPVKQGAGHAAAMDGRHRSACSQAAPAGHADA